MISCVNIGNPILFDTLIEKGEIEPMIIVTPTYNNSPDGAYDVWDEIRQSVIPYVESRYSAYAESTDQEGLMNSRMHRAYAGVSMGAVSVWYNMVHNLDIIAYYLPISGHFQNGNTEMLLHAIESFGMQKNDYFVFAATGTMDLACSDMDAQITEMLSSDLFISADDFSSGNLCYLKGEDKVHWYGHFREYLYCRLQMISR